jgi:cytochrome P450
MADDQAQDRSEPVPTGVQLTALDPVFRADPHPVLAHLREREPIHYDDKLKRWVLTRESDCDRVLRDRTMAVDPRKANEGTYMRLLAPPPGREPSMLMRDPPAHTRLRALVSKAFTTRAVERLAPRIEEIIDDLLSAVAGQECFDLIEALAAPLPLIVIAEMLGVDPADRARFRRWSEVMSMSFNPRLTDQQRAELAEGQRQLDVYFGDVIAERRVSPRQDLISAMIAAEESGDRLSDTEVGALCGLLLVAGNVTTTDLIGNGVWTLLRHPDQVEKLRAQPSLIGRAVEEILRFEPSVVQTARIATVDVEIGGCPIRLGESVLVSLVAANRDPDVYREPDRFDITREGVHHHSFGGGVHFCLGAPLARLEASLAIAEVLRRFPGLRLAEDAVEWRSTPAHRGLTRLHVLV